MLKQIVDKRQEMFKLQGPNISSLSQQIIARLSSNSAAVCREHLPLRKFSSCSHHMYLAAKFIIIIIFTQRIMTILSSLCSLLRENLSSYFRTTWQPFHHVYYYMTNSSSCVLRDNLFFFVSKTHAQMWWMAHSYVAHLDTEYYQGA